MEIVKGLEEKWQDQSSGLRKFICEESNGGRTQSGETNEGEDR